MSLWDKPWSGIWAGLNWLRETLNWVFDNWIKAPLSDIKDGLQKLLKAIWDWPTTWRNFVRAVEKGFLSWYNKAIEYGRTFARELFNFLITPFRPILTWWNRYSELIWEFVRNPWTFIWKYFSLGWTTFWNWVYAHAPFLRYLLVDIPTLIKNWFTYNYDYYRRLYNDYRERLWSFFRDQYTYWTKVYNDFRQTLWAFLDDPWGFIYRRLVKMLEELGALMYVIILEFVNRIWRP